VASFIVPENCWLEHCYYPQDSVQVDFLKKHEGKENVEEFIANQRHETQLYFKYKAFYGYVFYIGKKK
jgi:hypothetical protein